MGQYSDQKAAAKAEIRATLYKAVVMGELTILADPRLPENDSGYVFESLTLPNELSANGNIENAVTLLAELFLHFPKGPEQLLFEKLDESLKS